MTSDFTAAVVPVFLEALDLFDRAEKNKTGPVEVERATLRAAFDRAAAKMRGPRLPEWELASYAIAAMVDEILIVDMPWSGQAGCRACSSQAPSCRRVARQMAVRQSRGPAHRSHRGRP